MEIKTKHRVVGILVVIGLAVIVIPILFSRTDKQAAETTKLTATIPTPPTKPQIELNLPKTPSAADLTQPASLPNTQANLRKDAQTTRLSPSIVENPTSADNDAQSLNSTGANPPIIQATTPVTSAIASVPVTKPSQSPAPVIKKPQAKPQAEKSATKTKLTANKPAAKPVAKTKPTAALTVAKASAFSVQLGAFTNIKNAQGLVDKLRKDGFKAYIKHSKAEKGTLVRVMVGPVTKKTKAEALQKELRQRFNLKGMVVDYQL